MKVQGVICPNEECGAFIFSRARHDYHHCPCGEVSIDGGRDYLRVGFKGQAPQAGEYDFPGDQRMLFDDWNQHTDKYGVVPAERVPEVVSIVETKTEADLVPAQERDSPWPSLEERDYWMPKGRDTALSVVGKVNSLKGKEGWREELVEHTALELARMFAIVARERNLADKDAMMEGLRRAASEMDDDKKIIKG